jgi:N-acetylglutamate synthase-like GNAT family acetyltransferase
VIRTAVLADVEAIEELIVASVHGLQVADYTQAQRDGALGTVFGTDSQMIADGTYYVIEEEGRIVGCGGWSQRRTPFGGDHSPHKDDSFLDPATDAARIRAFFVHPDFARRGLGTMLLHTCEDAARAAGFTRVELTSTLTGIPLYEVRGFVARERIELPLSNGATLPVVRMEKSLA